MKSFIWYQLSHELKSPRTVKSGHLNKEITSLTGTSNNQRKIKHRARNCTIDMDYDDFYSAFEKSLIEIIQTGNKSINSNDLKRFVPSCFDEKKYPKTAHVCNRAAFFALMIILKITDKVDGKRKRGSPYNVIMFP